jgi:hypothetical protein
MDGADAMARAAAAMQAAADKMQAAAHKMERAQADMDYTLTNHQRFLRMWAEDFHEAMQGCLPSPGAPLEVRIVGADPEDTHAAKTMPAPGHPESAPTEGAEDPEVA